MEQAAMPEVPPMSARFRITERDYLRAGAFAAQPTRRMRAALLLLGVLIVGVLGFGAGNWGEVIGLAGVGAVAWLVTAWLFQPWMLRRHYRRYQAIHDEQTVTLLDDGVRFVSAISESRLAWSKILKWRCNADYVLIYLMPRLFHMIPTRIAEQGFDMERLKAALAQHVGPAEWGR